MNLLSLLSTASVSINIMTDSNQPLSEDVKTLFVTLVRVHDGNANGAQYQSVYECTICHERVPFLPKTI